MFSKNNLHSRLTSLVLYGHDENHRDEKEQKQNNGKTLTKREKSKKERKKNPTKTTKRRRKRKGGVGRGNKVTINLIIQLLTTTNFSKITEVNLVSSSTTLPLRTANRRHLTLATSLLRPAKTFKAPRSIIYPGKITSLLSA